MVRKAETPNRPIELGQAEVEALGAGRRDAMRAWVRRLNLATPSPSAAEGLRSEKLAPVPLDRSELRALKAGKAMPEALGKRLEQAARKARAVEKRAKARKRESDGPSRPPPE